MILLGETRQVVVSQEMAMQIEEINERLWVVEFAIQELTLEETMEATKHAMQASRKLLAAVQKYLCAEQCSDYGVDAQHHGSSPKWKPALPLDFQPWSYLYRVTRLVRQSLSEKE